MGKKLEFLVSFLLVPLKISFTQLIRRLYDNLSAYFVLKNPQIPRFCRGLLFHLYIAILFQHQLLVPGEIQCHLSPLCSHWSVFRPGYHAFQSSSLLSI